MNNNERYLPGFNQFLCGKSPKSTLVKIQEKVNWLRKSTLSELSEVFGEWIPSKFLQSKDIGINSRNRLYSQNVTFWAFLAQVLSPQTPCREIVRKIQSFCSLSKRTLPASGTAAFCRARKRLRNDDLEQIQSAIISKATNRLLRDQLWKNHSVKVIDGTGVALADTPQNQKAYPQPSEQRAGCGFPVLKLVACFCLHTGVLLHFVQSNLHCYEGKLFTLFLKIFSSGDVVLADRGFCSYGNIAELHQRNIHSVMRLHQARKVDYRNGKSLGTQDRLVIWKRPKQRGAAWSRQEWKSLPETLQLRMVRVYVGIKGFRTQQYELITTLTDANTYTYNDLKELYFQRWNVELYFRNIKTSMGMESLRCKTPEMVLKELQMFLIAYNLVRGLMQEAAISHAVNMERMSFKATVDTLRQYSNPIAHRASRKQKQKTYEEMIFLIANEVVPLRQFRSEPRAVKKRPKGYQRLTKPRHQFKVSASRKMK